MFQSQHAACCDPRRHVFQGVHMLLQFSSSADGVGCPWKEGEKRTNKIVFIGKNLDRRVHAPAHARCKSAAQHGCMSLCCFGASPPAIICIVFIGKNLDRRVPALEHAVVAQYNSMAALAELAGCRPLTRVTYSCA